jgi:amino acid adenylation domain-containing protein
MHRQTILESTGSLSFALGEDGAYLTEAGMRLECVGIERSTAEFELSFTAAETAAGIRFQITYDQTLYEHGAIHQMGTHLLRLIEVGTAEPARRVGLLLTGQPDHPDARPRGMSLSDGVHAGSIRIHQIIEQQAKATPDRVALVDNALHVTYEVLNRRARALAHKLRLAGAGPEKTVLVCMERGSPLVEAIVGVLNSGAAYVPVEPATPAERLSYIARDVQPAAIITSASWEHFVAPPTPVFCLDATFEAGNRDHEPVSCRVSPQNLAYIIYTSGSTGRPKGVGVTHENVERLLSETRPWFGFCGNDTWTLFHSQAFDFSVWEMFGCLCTGGRLVIVPYWISRSSADFHSLVIREQITVLNQTPSAFEEFSRADRESKGAGRTALRLVIFGGEALDFARLAPWFERNGDSRPELVNMYGITETTVHVTYRPVRWTDCNKRGSRIGMSIPDLELYAMDDNGTCVPRDLAGELYVGGVGVARGYINQPALTAERFLPDPFSKRGGARLYRTGDLARARWDGDFEYVGRRDGQLKIRGHRIEPGEIEVVLRQHPEVSQCVVVLREDTAGTKRLAAYVVPTGDPDPLELRKHVRAHLPEDMVPAAVIIVTSLPLTINGKLDSKALPPPLAELTALPSRDDPTTPTESALVAVWREVLCLGHIGVRQNFFDLGGDSILSMRIVAKAREMGFTITPKLIFDHPFISDLASAVDREGLCSSAGPVAFPSRNDCPCVDDDAFEAILMDLNRRGTWEDQSVLAPGSLTANEPG